MQVSAHCGAESFPPNSAQTWVRQLNALNCQGSSGSPLWKSLWNQTCNLDKGASVATWRVTTVPVALPFLLALASAAHADEISVTVALPGTAPEGRTALWATGLGPISPGELTATTKRYYLKPETQPRLGRVSRGGSEGRRGASYLA